MLLLLNNETKFNINSPNRLDICYDRKFYHGHYESVQNLKQLVTYVCKDKNYKTNISNLKDGRLVSAKEMLLCRMKEIGPEAALIEYIFSFLILDILIKLYFLFNGLNPVFFIGR